MKKQLILSLSFVAAVAASAQTSLVKEVERNLKSKVDDYPAQVKALTPAFTNEETAETAYPYFVAGKYGVDFYEKKEIENRAGMAVNVKDMGHALIDSYGYLVKALQRDSVADAKGKIKTKYSKDAIKLIGKAYPQFDNAAILLWGEKDYQGAYDAWELLFSAPEDPVLGENAPVALPDSILNVISFNQGLAAYNLEDWTGTLRSFDRAIAKGNNSKNVYDFAMAAAANLPDSIRAGVIAKYAEMAYPLYGAEDDRYIGNIINNMMQQGNYAEAETMLNKYIAEQPDNAQLYFILGVVYENQESDPNSEDKAAEQFKKCVTLDPNHVMANVQLGQLLFNKAAKLDEEASSMSTPEYNAHRTNVVEPVLREAAVYFEKAYEVDPDNSYSALANLRSIYYNLNDAENMERITKLQQL